MNYSGSDKHKKALFENKQDKLTAGDNITLTPQQDGTVRIDAEGGGSGTVTDVEVDGTSVVNEEGVAEIPAIPSNLNDLSDVSASSPSNGDSLKYNSQTQKWEPGEAGGGNVDDVVMNGTSIVNNKVASFTNYVEITRAEYDALPDTKYTDNILYCIKDSGASNADFFAPIVYSLAEREVGVWTDGKPLYQKSVVITNIPSNNLTYTAHGISNIDTIVDVQGICHVLPSVDANNAFTPLPRIQDNNASALMAVDVNNTNIILKGRGETFNSIYDKVVVTLQYTKTTDVAGSGKWGQDGVPAVHYSTSEKVIGTWIDGSTLYEKVISAVSPALTQDTVIDSSINQNTVALVKVDGTWSIGAFGYTGSSQVNILQNCYFYTSNVDVPPPKVRLTSNGLTLIKTNNYSYGFEYRLVLQYTKLS